MSTQWVRANAYEPARGTAAVICWILIVGCTAILLLSLGAWVAYPAGGFPFLEMLLPVVGIVGSIARLRGWAPPPKGGAGGVGP